MTRFFAKPIFHGQRFDGHTLPLDVVRELQAYQDAVVQLAAYQWREENPARERLPAGFESSFRLTIMGLDRDVGCTGVLLGILHDSSAQGVIQEVGPQHLQYYMAGRDLLNQISAGQDSLPSLPPKARKALRKIGEGLGPDEYFLLGKSEDAATGPRIDASLGRKFARGSNRDAPVAVKGLFDSRSVRDHSIGLIVDNRVVRCRVPDGDISLWNSYLDHLVLVEGTGLLNEDDEVLEVTHVDEVVLAEPAQIPIQLDRLRRLDNGWCGPGSIAPARHLLSDFQRMLALLDQERLPRPSLYATEEGGARAEWTMLPYEIALILSPSDESPLLLEVFDRRCRDFVVDRPVTEERLVAELRGYLEGDDAH